MNKKVNLIVIFAAFTLTGFNLGRILTEQRIEKKLSKLQSQCTRREKELENEIDAKRDKGFEIDPDWEDEETKKLKSQIMILLEEQNIEKGKWKAYQNIWMEL